MKILEGGNYYEILCEDSYNYLKKAKDVKAIITSLPDMEEVSMDIENWTIWVKEISELIAECLSNEGVVFFYQTNRKLNGKVIDKKSIISNVFYEKGFSTIIDKIVLKQEVNTISLFRPGFTNLFAFSKKLKSGKATSDVFPAGEMLYKNAMGFNACQLAIDYIKRNVDTDVILDPFCGMGSVIKISKDCGYSAIGIDILPEMCDATKSILVNKD